MDWSLFWTAAGVLAAVAAAVIPLTIWLIDRRKSKELDSEYSIEDSDWVVEKGLTYEEFLRQLISLDHAALAGLSDKTAGNEKVKALVFEKSKETWSLVVFRNSLIVGYWSCFSLSSKLQKKVEQGTLFDSEIIAAEVKQIHETGDHSLYFEMFGIHPAFGANRRTIFRLLTRSLAGFAEMLEREKVSVKAVYANGYSSEGAALCRAFGLAPFITSVQGGEVYRSTDINTLGKRLSRQR